MINLLISLGAALGLGVPVSLWLGWVAAVLPGLVLGVGIYFLLARKTTKQLEQIMEQAGAELQAGRIHRGVAILETAYPLQKRQFLVRSQIDAQIGAIHFLQKKYDEARPLLENAVRNNSIARGMLAVLLFRRHKLDEALETIEEAIRFNKKEPLLWALQAFLLDKVKRKSDALEVLSRGLARLPENEALKTAQVSLQNGQKMKTRAFGDAWYQFGLEQPPKSSRTVRPFGKAGHMSKKQRR